MAFRHDAPVSEVSVSKRARTIDPGAKHRVIRLVPVLDAPEQEICVSNVPALVASLAAVPLDVLCSLEFMLVQPRMKVSRKRRIETLRVNSFPFLLMVDLRTLYAA